MDAVDAFETIHETLEVLQIRHVKRDCAGEDSVFGVNRERSDVRFQVFRDDRRDVVDHSDAVLPHQAQGRDKLHVLLMTPVDLEDAVAVIDQ